MQEILNNKIKLNDKKIENLFGKPEKYDYSKFEKLENFCWDSELGNKFFEIAQNLNLSQESLEKLLEIALEMSEKQKEIYEQDQIKKIEKDIFNYNKMLNEDEELPNINSIQMKKYMETANSAYSDFTTPKLKELLEKTGLVYHPEIIKMFNKIGELSKEDSLSYQGKPIVEELTPAQILYGKNN